MKEMYENVNSSVIANYILRSSLMRLYKPNIDFTNLRERIASLAYAIIS